MAMGEVPAHARALVETDEGRRAHDDRRGADWARAQLAVQALALHPLVPSVITAREIFDGYRERLPALQEAFA